MCFRIVYRVLLVILLGLGVAQCSSQIDEKPAGNRDVKVGDQVGCLSDIGEKAISFLEAKLDNKDVTETLDCLAFSLEAFESYTKGESRDSYKPEEVRDFLQKFFFNRRQEAQNLVLTDAFLEELTHLKAMILGGRPEVITRQELRLFVQRVKDIKRALLVVNPYMSVVNWALKSDSKVSHLQTNLKADLGQAALKEMAEILVESMPDGELLDPDYRYDMNRVGSLIAEFRKFIKYDDSSARKPEVWGEFIKEFHIFTTGGTAQLNQEKAKQFLRVFATWYGWMGVVRVDFQSREGSFFYGEKLQAMHKVITQLFPMLRNVIFRRPSQMLDFKDVERFAVALEKMNMIPFRIRGTSLSSVVQGFVEKVLGDPEVPSALRDERGVLPRHIDMVQYEYSIWYEVQKYLSDHRADPKIDQQMLSSQNNDFESFAEMTHLVGELRPLIPDDHYSIMLVEEAKIEAYNIYHDASGLTIMNIFRALFRLTIRGFGSYNPHVSVIYQGMTSDQFQAVYDAIQPLGIDARLMDPRSKGSGHRSFLEANLFTYESNGFQDPTAVNEPVDALVSFAEGVQFLTYLYSAAQLGSRVYNELAERVPLSAEKHLDVKGMRFLDRRQSVMNFASVILQKVETMPGLTEFLASASGEERQEFAESLFRAARNSNPQEHDQDKWFEKSELDVAVAVMQYSESVMTRFNSDEDEFLNDEEVEAAFPVFQEFLRDMVKKMCVTIPDWIDEDWFILSVFREIVSTGEIPAGDLGRWGQARLIGRFARRDYLWSIELNRLDVIKVFSSVVAKSSEAAAKKAEGGGGSSCATD
jgi:hypothetical protein